MGDTGSSWTTESRFVQHELVSIGIGDIGSPGTLRTCLERYEIGDVRSPSTIRTCLEQHGSTSSRIDRQDLVPEKHLSVHNTSATSQDCCYEPQIKRKSLIPSHKHTTNPNKNKNACRVCMYSTFSRPTRRRALCQISDSQESLKSN
jgi:hypothetical protein